MSTTQAVVRDRPDKFNNCYCFNPQFKYMNFIYSLLHVHVYLDVYT